MATKPTPGGSDGTYGTEMNAFLDVSLASDGKVKDGAVFSTSAAPSVDAGVANKKYVDDTVPTGDNPVLVDSESNTMLKDQAYLTQTAGYVTSFIINSAGLIRGFVGNTTNPAGAGVEVNRCQINDAVGDPSIAFFIGNGKYFEITATSGTPVITWTPLVSSGGNPIDQD